jgi:hypothetical protein
VCCKADNFEQKLKQFPSYFIRIFSYILRSGTLLLDCVDREIGLQNDQVSTGGLSLTLLVIQKDGYLVSVTSVFVLLQYLSQE